MKTRLIVFVAAGLLAAVPAAYPQEVPPATVEAGSGKTSAPPPGPAEVVAASVDDPGLRLLLAEILERNPGIASLEAAARAAALRAPQVKALPDPVLSVTAFLMSPETRVGPQYGTVALAQHFPWFGKLPLKEQVALAEAAAAAARVETRRLELVTEARRLAHELAFLDLWEHEVRADRATLEHYEELARARYTSGVGLQQAIVKIQAEITRDDTRLVELDTRKNTLRARLNAMRDRPERTPLPTFELPEARELDLAIPALRRAALDRRPEFAEVDALLARAGHRADLAQKDYTPDVTAGLAWTWVGKRSDPAGELNPPENNGKDVLALFGSINLPVYRENRAAAVEEAGEERLEAEARRRAVSADIEGDLADLTQRIDDAWRRLRLFEDVLIHQARQSLDSAESGYASGTQDALDLLDAERILLEVRVATARAWADWAVAVAQLEGVTATPLARISGTPETETER